MTTSGTKTRALCVATRCTTVDQFVATFHRFCGDDQSFFVATMTSRPIGLETPFSIQLADKQPVLRGLCIVLDAWATPENRYKRPGIRLGIKRLTADSQLVFDRLRAASKSIGIAEATPPPGPPPELPVPSRGSPPPQPLPSFAQPHATLRGSLAPAAPQPPVALRGSPPSQAPVAPQPPVALRGSPPSQAPVVPPVVPSVQARTTAMPPPLPRVITARREAPPEIPPPPLPPVPPVEPAPAPAGEPRVAPAALDARPVAVAVAVAAEPGSRPAAASGHPTPIAVTRFQVALNVDGTLPPTDAIEFRPRQLPYRPRVEPRIVSDPEPGASAYDEPGTPAMIVDRPSDPLRERHAVPSATAGELRQRPQDVAVGEPDRRGEPLPAIDQRTPGSALVLPANPLQDLSDESIEGFVDCTLYEESGNFFHPAAEDGEWNDDELADPPAAPPTKRSTGPGTVPAMPYDTAPDLTVLARGNTESLRVAPDAPPAAPQQAMPQQAMPQQAMPQQAMPQQAMPQQAMPQQAMPQQAMPQQAMPQMLQSTSSPAQQSTDASFAPPWPDAANASGPAYPTYPTVDASQYAPQYATPQPSQSRAQPVALPEPETLRLAPMWPRWLIIGGTALAAIVVAFILARLVRGSPRAETDRAIATRAAPSSTGTSGPAPNRSASDPPASSRSASSSSTAGSSTAGSSASSSSTAGSSASGSSTAGSSAAGSSSGDPASPDDEEGGVVGPGGAPVVGHGPCRFNVATTPAGSIVRLDDQAMGPSPLTIDATCEKHRVDLSHARYQTVTRWVTLAADKPQDLEVNLPRPIHAVTVTSFPPGAELSIDGRRAGTTPTVVQMMGFATVNLTFSKAGFQSVTKKVYSKLAQDHVFVKLMK